MDRRDNIPETGPSWQDIACIHVGCVTRKHKGSIITVCEVRCPCTCNLCELGMSGTYTLPYMYVMAVVRTYM